MSSTTTAKPTRRLGLVSTTALVVGGIIGTGIFTAPAEVAQFGWVVYPAFAIVTVGSILLALTFASLARRYSESGGPSYGYAREAFGEFTGFISAWGYWIQGWTGQATIAVAGAGYAASLFGLDGNGTPLLFLALAILWIPVIPNLIGTRSVGNIQVITTFLKLLPLIAVGVVGLIMFKAGDIGSVEPSAASSPLAAIAPAAVLLLFSFLGMEGASVAADRVDNPRRTLPKAVVFGVIICAAVYLVGIAGVQATIPQSTLANSTAPFSDAATVLVGASWAGSLISVAAIISALGALNGWTMVNGEMVNAAARDGVFPNVSASAPGTIPVRAIVINTILATILVFSAASDGFQACSRPWRC